MFLSRRRRQLVGGVPSDVRLALSGRDILGTAGTPIYLGGTNQGTWGEDYEPDAAWIVSKCANTATQYPCIRYVGVRWNSASYETGIDCYSPNAADHYIKPGHLASILQVLGWAVAAGAWVIFVFDSNDGAGAGTHGIGSGLWNFWETSAEQAQYWAEFKVMQKYVMSKVKTFPNIAAVELLAEPMPGGSDSSWAPLLRDKYRELRLNVRSEDPRVPVLIGPRDSYGLNFLSEILLPELSDVIYTADFLSNKVSTDSTIAADVETIYNFGVANNVPVLIQQFGRETGDDDGDGSTTDNVPYTGLTGGLFVCRARGVHVTHWQNHQNTDNPLKYGLWYKTVYPGSGVDNWTPKTEEIAIFEFMMKLNGASLEAAAIAAATAEGWRLAYIKDDLSNCFQDAAGTIPVTAVGQFVHRINDVVGGGNWQQTGADTLAPQLALGPNGYTLNFVGANNQFLAYNSVFWAAGDNIVAIASGRSNAGSSNRVLLNEGNASGTARYPYLAVLATDAATFSLRGDDNVNQDSQSVTTCDNRSIVITGILASATDKRLGLNAVQEGATNTTAIGSIASLTRLRWGASSTGANGWDGKSALVCLGKTGGASNRRAVEMFAAWKEAAPYRAALP